MTSAVKRNLAVLLAALVALTTLSACSDASAGEADTIRYQSYTGQVDVLQLAAALGHLDGIKLEKVGDVTGGPESVQAVASNQIDISASAFFGAIAQVVASGVPVKAVVSTYGSSDKISSALVTSPDSDITEARDLIGKKVGVNTLGANAEAVLDTWLVQEGLSQDEIDQVTLVPLPPLNLIQALDEGQIDVASVGSGQITAAESTGVELRTLVKDTDVIGSYNGGGFVMRENFLEENPDTAEKVVTGVAKAVAYIESHSREETLEVYTKWLEDNGFEDYVEAVEQNWAGTTGVESTETAEIADDDIAIWLDWLETRGDVDPSDIEPSDVYTNDFNELAED